MHVIMWYKRARLRGYRLVRCPEAARSTRHSLNQDASRNLCLSLSDMTGIKRIVSRDVCREESWRGGGEGRSLHAPTAIAMLAEVGMSDFHPRINET